MPPRRLTTVLAGVTALMGMATVMLATRARLRHRSSPKRKRTEPTLMRLVRGDDESGKKLTGLPWAMIDLLITKLGRHLEPRAGLTAADQICAFLIWLRHYPRLSLLSAQSGNPGEATMWRVVNDVLAVFVPHLSGALRLPPINELRGQLEWRHSVIGVLDGTPLSIRRPLQDQARFYRGDKARHFITMLLLCDVQGRILWVGVGYPGHNNDQANYSNSSLRPFVRAAGVELLTDGGFFGNELIRPLVRPSDALQEAFNTIIQDNRAVVEHVNVDVKEFEILSGRFRGSRILLTNAALAVCILHNILQAWKNDNNDT